MKVRKVTTERQQQKLNVAAYARVSTLSEEQEESFDTQVEYYTAYIQSVDEWNFVDVYADQGKSGLSADKRPGFQRMIRDAMDGKIDKILVKSISRLGRSFNKNSHFLKGKVICGDCVKPYVRNSRRNAKGDYKTWDCKGRKGGVVQRKFTIG